jgi:hypothetical protein
VKSKAVERKASETEISEKMLWRIVFDFKKKIEEKGAEANSKGERGTLYSNYLIRQGPLSAENDQILKQKSQQYFLEVDPLIQNARTIRENYDKTKDKSLLDQVKGLQRQRDEIALRLRDEIKQAFGEEAFNGFANFLKTDFTGGMKSFQPNIPEGFGNVPVPVGETLILWDETAYPTLISGYTYLYLDLFFSDFQSWNPYIESYLVNYSTGSIYEFGWNEGYRDWVPAEVFHSIFISNVGQTYCTVADGWALLYDGPMVVDEYYYGQPYDCHTVNAPPPTPTPTPTPTPNVVSVTFSQVTPSTQNITPNPTVLPHNPGIGERIFPDDDFPDDPVNRRVVRVTATISPAIPNVNVHFRNFDLDDPTSNTTVDPNGTFGNDNSGTPIAGTLSSMSSVTNGSGIATVDFTVTRQPGDNFAIAASTVEAQANGVNVAGIELTNASGQNIPTVCVTELVCRSQMLTVWRRLHIEVDSMGPVVENRALGRIATTTRIRSNEVRTIPLTASDGTAANLEPNRFEGGRMTTGFGALRVECNLTNIDTTDDFCNDFNSVRVRNTSGGLLTLIAGTPIQLYDDDDFNDNDGPPPTGDGSLDGDTDEDIPLRETDLALLTADNDDPAANILAQAYMRPVYDIVDRDDDGFFQANAFGIAAPDIRPFFIDRDLTTTSTDVEFWTVYILGAYQSAVFADNDPPGLLVFGHADGIPTTSDGDGSGFAIFQEAHSSKEIVAYPNDPGDPSLRHVSTTVGHEIGHLLSGQHGDGDIMTDGTGIIRSRRFHPTTIRRIRSQLLHP